MEIVRDSEFRMFELITCVSNKIVAGEFDLEYGHETLTAKQRL